MVRRKRITSPLFITVMILILVTAAICIFAVARTGSKLQFSAKYYYVCYKHTDSAVSAGSISGVVSSYGGAGYIIEYDDAFYVTVACYYSERDAETVQASLARRDLECQVLEIERNEYILPNLSAKRKSKQYAGNLNTLNELSQLAYECANSMDKGDCGQSKAKSVISSIEKGLETLKKANGGNCFEKEITGLLAECFDAGSGYIYSRDLRALQIAICDTIINIELY